jgi:hypothetical protein
MELTANEVVALFTITMEISRLSGIEFAPRIVASGANDEAMIVGACTDFLREVVSSSPVLARLEAESPLLAEWLLEMPP